MYCQIHLGLAVMFNPAVSKKLMKRTYINGTDVSLPKKHEYGFFEEIIINENDISWNWHCRIKDLCSGCRRRMAKGVKKR